MDKKIVTKINREVADQFPDLVGVKPKIKRQPTPGGQQYLLTYKSTAILPGDKEIQIIVRVVADEMGDILRLSMSK